MILKKKIFYVNFVFWAVARILKLFFTTLATKKMIIRFDMAFHLAYINLVLFFLFVLNMDELNTCSWDADFVPEGADIYSVNA